MHKATLGDRLRYAFDNFMSRGTLALIAGLAVASAVLIIAVTAVLILTGTAEGIAFGELAWMGLLRTLDTGTMGGDEGNGLFLAGMLVITLGGVFTVSTLIGVLNNGLEDKLSELRKGRSRVIEAGHTVILGWSEHIFPVVSELIIANANQRKSCIVILADRDKVEMEDEIRDKAGPSGRTRIICRRGSPVDPLDIAIASVDAARSIIVLAPQAADADASVIKTLLAITHSPARRAGPYHIVAEISEARNAEVARLVGKDEVELVQVGGLVARIIAQTCRQSGLSVVYTELLDFGGDEIYFKAEPALAGKTYAEALSAYEDSAVIGLRPRGGAPQLNPPMSTRLAEGDQLVVIAEDDDKIRLSNLLNPEIQADAIQLRDPAAPTPEHTLILGWNRRAQAIVRELDNYVALGSEVLVVADAGGAEAALAETAAGLANQTARFQAGDTTDRRVLDGLGIERFRHIIVLAYAESLDVQVADAHTLITLLHLRDMIEQAQYNLSIVSEMLDVRNRNLAEVTRADDFIVSDRLVSLILAQVSENKALNAVFADLFDPEGAEVYLKLASNYVQAGVPINFYTVVEAARRRGETALGYRLQDLAGKPDQAYGVVINPEKSRSVTFSEWDRIVVLAES